MKLVRILIVLFVFSTAFAQTLFSQENNLSPEKIEEVIGMAGLESQVESTADLIAESMKMYSFSLKRDASLKYDVLIGKAYEKTRFYSDFKKIFSGKLRVADIPGIEKWFSSPLGIKITEIEKKSLSPESAKAFVDYLPQSLSLSEKRKNLVREFLKATFADEFSEKIVCEPMTVMITATRESVPGRMRRGETVFRENLDGIEREALIRYRFLLPVSTAYAYRDISDEEFSIMIDFYNSPPGRNFTVAVMESVISAMNIAARDCGSGMARIIRDAGEKPSGTKVNGE
ncbi:MAG: hypothetical protein WCS96_08995 [Victivallales bacterium]